MVKFFKYTSKGMTLLELSACIVVVSIIALGMTSGAQAVMLHYQADTVRQDLRQYGNNVMREITRELNLAQKIEIDGQNGFSRIKLYEKFTDISPELTISCHNKYGIRFNGDDPVDGVLNFPIEGVFRGRGRREIYVDDFVVQYETAGSPSLSVFKNSYIHLTLNLAMKSDVMDEVTQDIIEEHTYHRTVFLGTAYIQTKVTNAMSEDNA
ncbi:MAG TPA: type II secretion system protein [Candidatus Marinimicrobia bacterium]|jgi:prepilin-type N-terminal cleavage/methylation domain-containing protein|nr:type II secretion system protein [Candidatus Neomarinimicrobiota bacterium]